MKRLFDLFKEKNIKININKCAFLQKEISYLGFLIDGTGFKPDPTRIKPFKMWPEPKQRNNFKTFGNYKLV